MVDVPGVAATAGFSFPLIPINPLITPAGAAASAPARIASKLPTPPGGARGLFELTAECKVYVQILATIKDWRTLAAV